MSDSPINAISFQNFAANDSRVTIAVGSLVKQKKNTVKILKLANLDNSEVKIQKSFEFLHNYPPSKLMWAPKECSRNDLLASASENVQIWEI